MKKVLEKIWILPVLLSVLFLASISSCETEESDSGADSLSVTVNFTGNEIPDPGDILMVVVYNSDVTELDIETEIDPDLIAPVLLTQDMIDNGVTVNLDTINLDEPQMYIGAFVDLDGDMEPGPGDLIEFYQDITLIDAFTNDVLPPNANGLTSVEINLDEILTLSSLAVTVNFIGNTVPDPDDVLNIGIFYSSLAGVAEIEPDDGLNHVLTAGDILDGVTLTFNTIFPWEPEVYIGIFVDTDGDESPGAGELVEVYEDKGFIEVVAGTAAADNAFGETAVTVNLDLTMPI